MELENSLPDRLVRARELQTRYGVRGYSTLWRWVREGRLPEPHYLNGARVWWLSAIEESERRVLKNDFPAPSGARRAAK